jgi:hypothetical protein
MREERRVLAWASWASVWSKGGGVVSLVVYFRRKGVHERGFGG